MIYHLTLPQRPPSVNNLFINATKVGRIPSKGYKAWRAAMEPIVRASGAPRFEAPVRVEYLFQRPDRRKRDLGNLEKALSDLLVSAGVLADDSLIVDLRMAWGGDHPATVRVTLAGEAA